MDILDVIVGVLGVNKFPSIILLLVSSSCGIVER
jgi:hypothetical protein